MKKITSLLLFTLLFFSGTVLSQNETDPKLILLVDKSGSLKSNDPVDLRKDALQFLIEQNNSWNKIAIYAFGSEVKGYHPDQQNIFFDSQKDKQELVKIIKSLSRNDALSDLRKGLSKIYEDLTRANSWKNIRILIFTDAQLKIGDIPAGVTINDYLLGLYSLAKLFAEKNITIDGVAFTKNADISYLQTLSSLTNGYALHAASPEVVSQIIAQLISRNLKGPLAANREIEINVSSLVSSFKVYAFNNRINSILPTISLKDPQGNPDSDYEKITYKTSVTIEKNNPRQGIWTALVSGADDVRVYYGKRIDYDLIIHQPMAKDLSLCRNSVVPFNIEIKSEKEENLLGTQCEVFLQDSTMKSLQMQMLEKNGSRFSGNLKITVTKGIYDLLIRLSKDEDFIEKKYTVNVNDCADLDYKFNYDIVVKNPVMVSIVKPSEEKSKIELYIKNPQDERIEQELFDDGSEGHGDNLANDGILSTKIDNLSVAGKYELEFSLSYEKNGIPVVSKHIEDVYKVITVDPENINISYPGDSVWTSMQNIKINNLTSYKIILREILPDDQYVNNIKIVFPDPNMTILPREEKMINLSVNGLRLLKGEHKLSNYFYCDLIDSQREENTLRNAKINLTVVLKPATPLSFKILITIVSVIFLLLLLIITGLFLIVPLRFKNTFYQNYDQEIGINEFRKFGYPYVDFEDIGRIGISFFGYGYWYFKYRDDENVEVVQKYFTNINLHKENF